MFVVAIGDKVIAPRDHLARSIHSAFEEVESAWPVVIVLHVVFTSPDKLHRHARLHGDVRNLNHVVVGKSAAKRTAGTE